MAGSRLADRRVALGAICAFVAPRRRLERRPLPAERGLRRARPHRLRRRARPARPVPPARRASTTRRPGYYAVAGTLDWLAGKTGIGDPHRAGMAVNVFFLLGTVLLVRADRARALAGPATDRARRRGVRRLPAGDGRDRGHVPPGDDVAVLLDARALALRQDLRRPALRVGGRRRARRRPARPRLGARHRGGRADRARRRPPLAGARDRGGAGGARSRPPGTCTSG